MAKVAVCLSGCGFLDGAEIHESVFTLLALDQAGADVLCCAPDVPQAQVVDHLTKERVGEQRNVLSESARIARSQIVPVSQVKADSIDALIFPGGFGAALNLCTFAVDGADCGVDPDVETLVAWMIEQRKPIGAICIAPAMIARIFGQRNLPAKLTIGDDPGTAESIEAMGAKHCTCSVTDTVVDEQHRIASTPAYMCGTRPAEVFEGIKKCVDAVLKMVQC